MRIYLRIRDLIPLGRSVLYYSLERQLVWKVLLYVF